jgi:hypothetical protein
MAKQTAIPSIVEMIVGRCHVGESNRAVIRYFVSRLKRGYKTWRKMPRPERKQWLTWVIRAHAANRELYRYVMNGR